MTTQKKLEDQEYHLIKAHMLDPDNSPLPVAQQRQLDRVKVASDLLDKSPRLKHTAEILRHKFPGLSIAQAYRDVTIARRLFTSNTVQEYDFWISWVLNDITKTIESCRSCNPPDNATITKCHANLIKLLGEKPADNIDAKLIEKNTFVIPIMVNNVMVNIDLKKLTKLDPSVRQEITRAILETGEITDVEAEDIMNS
jgi:hypothetical protein